MRPGNQAVTAFLQPFFLLAEQHTAIDVDAGAGDIGRLVAGQEGDQVGNFGGLALAAERRRIVQVLTGCRLRETVVEGSVDHAGGKRVHADTLGTQFLGHGAGVAEHGGLGGCIHGGAGAAAIPGRWAAPPAPAITRDTPRFLASFTASLTAS